MTATMERICDTFAALACDAAIWFNGRGRYFTLVNDCRQRIVLEEQALASIDAIHLFNAVCLAVAIKRFGCGRPAPGWGRR